MKLPRCTVRKLMLITAMIAVGLFVAQESWEGIPPRSVVQGIPARIARLKPGMTARQVHGNEAVRCTRPGRAIAARSR